ncbi:MAG: tetratricopeptide repeat protein [Spirochaetes bacterium]|nr:MAG: tetratricopeptide repeat protein [Spirochaetota bacterium]
MVTFLVAATIIIGGVVLYLMYIKPKLDPSFRAAAYEKQNMVYEAIIEYKKVLDQRPKDFMAHYRLANLYLQLNEIDQAILHLERVIEINKYNYEIDRLDIEKKLADSYYRRDDVEKAFQTYLDILSVYPGDPDALYHAAFISLGQEEFDFAQKHFERLVKVNKNDFEVFFGAGICSYQNQKLNEAINNFKLAVSINPYSDAANLAMAFANQKKRDFKQAIPYAIALRDRTPDASVKYLALRLHAFLLLQAKKNEEALKVFQEVVDFTRENDMQNELMLALFDIGYANLRSERSTQALEYWNELYRIDKTYNDIYRLVTQLRREIDIDLKSLRDDFEISIMDNIDEWIQNPFPATFLWDICGLKSERKLDLKNIMVTARIARTREGEGTPLAADGDTMELIDKFCQLDSENFRIIANRVVGKMGYKVDQILQTYREADGVDFMAYDAATKDKTLVWVRRWTKTMVGEIPLRNFAQAINDAKAKKGLLVTASDLTEPAKANLDKLPKVNVIFPEELGVHLKGII